MSTLAGTDAFVVNRAGVNYQVTAANFMSTVQDTDFLVVNRSGTNFKVTGLDVKAYLGGGAGGAAYFPFATVCWNVTSEGFGDGSIVYDGTKYYANTVIPGDSNTYSGYQISTDNGKTWNRVPRFGGLFFPAVLVAADNSLIACGTTGSLSTVGWLSGGIYRSTDGGGNWSLVQSGIGDVKSAALGIDPTNGKILVSVGGSDKNLWESSNNGASWTQITLSVGATSLSRSSQMPLLNGIQGYGGNWYFAVNASGGVGRVYSFPQGSSGSTSPTTVLGLSNLIYSISVSRGLGSDFFGVTGRTGSGFGSPWVGTFNTSFSPISSALPFPTSGNQITSNWVTGENKMMISAFSLGMVNGTLATTTVFSSSNGSLNDVSSLQPTNGGPPAPAPFFGQGACPTFMYKLGTQLISPVAFTPFLTSGWVL